MWMVFIALLFAVPPGDAPVCRGNPALAGKCFRVHGRLRSYNGNPTFRIWPIGSGRLIGVTGAKPGDAPILPGDVACGFDCDVVADFEMCPFSPSKPGVMQRACIEGVSGRVVHERH
jgi:hypothetical protein